MIVNACKVFIPEIFVCLPLRKKQEDLYTHQNKVPLLIKTTFEQWGVSSTASPSGKNCEGTLLQAHNRSRGCAFLPHDFLHDFHTLSTVLTLTKTHLFIVCLSDSNADFVALDGTSHVPWRATP